MTLLTVIAVGYGLYLNMDESQKNWTFSMSSKYPSIRIKVHLDLGNPMAAPNEPITAHDMVISYGANQIANNGVLFL